MQGNVSCLMVMSKKFVCVFEVKVWRAVRKVIRAVWPDYDIGLSDCKQSVDNVLVLKDIKLCPKNLTCFRARQSPQFHRAFIVTAKIS